MYSTATNNLTAPQADYQRIGLALGIASTFFLLRIYGFFDQSLNQDEMIERHIAELPIGELIHEPNSFPPLYHLLVKGWLTVIDSGEMALRTFSMACAIASVLLFWGMSRDIFGSRIGWISAWVISGSAYHVYYSQQGRMYMLTFLLAVATIWAFLRLLRKPTRPDWLWFVLAGTLGGYTNYYFCILLATLGLVALVQDWRRALRVILPAGIAIGVLCVPLLFLVQGDIQFQSGLREARPLSLASIGYTYFSFFSGYTLGPSRPELHTLPTHLAISRAALWCALVAMPLAWLSLVAFLNVSWKHRLSFLVAVFAPLVIVGVIGSVLNLTYNDRFLIWVAIPIYVTLAAGLALTKSSFARWLCVALLIVISLSAVWSRHHIDSHRNEDLRAVSQVISMESEGKQRHAVMVSAGYVTNVVKYYLPASFEVVHLMDNGSAAGSTDRAVDQIRSARSPFWFVYSREFHGDPNGEILAFVTGQYRAKKVGNFAGAELYFCEPSGK